MTPDNRLSASNPSKRRLTGPRGLLARFAHRHYRCRRVMWRLHIIPNLIGPFYRSGA